jgi:hypothetical protein
MASHEPTSADTPTGSLCGFFFRASQGARFEDGRHRLNATSPLTGRPSSSPLPEAHRFHVSLRSRCTAMLAGLRTLIQTRHRPDR